MIHRGVLIDLGLKVRLQVLFLLVYKQMLNKIEAHQNLKMCTYTGYIASG